MFGADSDTPILRSSPKASMYSTHILFRKFCERSQKDSQRKTYPTDLQWNFYTVELVKDTSFFSFV